MKLRKIASKIKWKFLEWIGYYKPHSKPVKTLNEKVLGFIETKKHITLPIRETEFLPEIIIPCYNHGKYLRYIFEIIGEKNYPITVINDCSTDNSESIISELKKNYTFNYINNKTNLKQWGSINKVISSSPNNQFMIINADDIVLPNWVDYAFEYFRESDVFMFGGNAFPFTLDVEENKNLNETLLSLIKQIKFKPKGKIHFFGPKDALNFDHDNSINLSFPGCVFLKSAWEFVGGMMPLEKRVSPYDDRDFEMRICSFFKIGVSEDICVFWRRESTTQRGWL